MKLVMARRIVQQNSLAGEKKIKETCAQLALLYKDRTGGGRGPVPFYPSFFIYLLDEFVLLRSRVNLITLSDSIPTAYRRRKFVLQNRLSHGGEVLFVRSRCSSAVRKPEGTRSKVRCVACIRNEHRIQASLGVVPLNSQ